MKVEFLIDKSEYKKLLNKRTVVATNKTIVKYSHEKVSGKNNYLLTLTCAGKKISDAEALSEQRIHVEKILADNQVKYRLLTEEASQFFVQHLYPYACEFETKLRKFIYTALFDIDEKAEGILVKAYKATMDKKSGSITQLPLKDFLSEKDLGEIFDFLFANDTFLSQVKDLVPTNDNRQRHKTKKQLLTELEHLDDQSVWKLIFAPVFPDSILPNIYEDIQHYRNDVMHMHNIGFEDYKKILKVFKKGIKDLDKQIAKNVVLEDSQVNVKALANGLNIFANYFSRTQIPVINWSDLVQRVAKSGIVASSMKYQDIVKIPLIEIPIFNPQVIDQVAKMSNMTTSSQVAETVRKISEQMQNLHTSSPDKKSDT